MPKTQRRTVRIVEYFPLELLDGLRSHARSAATIPERGAEGWTKSNVDPADSVRVFETLRVKPGFRLRAYQFRAGSNGNGVVYALPGEEFPEPADCKTKEEFILGPPEPPHALRSVMEAIEGDGSPLSYLSASLLVREPYEFGALWHGCSWSDHSLIGSDPKLNFAKDPRWHWFKRPPSDWGPQIALTKNRVTVSFFTYDFMGQESIYRHVDVYRRGVYKPTSKQRPQAPTFAFPEAWREIWPRSLMSAELETIHKYAHSK